MADWQDLGDRAAFSDEGIHVRELQNGDSVLVVIAQETQAMPMVYYNICPHQGRSLEFAAGKVLCGKRGEIICAAHGATFLPDSGECIAGPCQGSALRALETKLEGDRLWVRTAD